MDITYEESLGIKEKQATELLGAVVLPYDSQWSFDSVESSPAVKGYRNKMEYSFGDAEKDGPLTLGLHRKKSFYSILDVDECILTDGDYRAIVGAVRSFFAPIYADGKIGYYHRKKHQGYLRHILIRKGHASGEILIALVTSSDTSGFEEISFDSNVNYLISDTEQADGYNKTDAGSAAVELCTDIPKVSADCVTENRYSNNAFDTVAFVQNNFGTDKEAEVEKNAAALNELESVNEQKLLDIFCNKLLSLQLEGHISGILHIVNDSKSDVVKADKSEILFGRDYFFEELLGLKFRITPFSFFQTNSKGAELLYSKAREYLLGASEELGVVYDLYSGTGTIAQAISAAARKVYGVEIVAEAVEAARENAALNNIDNCEFICGDVLEVLDNMPETPDTIIVDPPREGMHPKALRKIISSNVSNILYISCKYKSLANELPVFFEHGYKIAKSCLVDMFPWTEHVETVCLLGRRKPDDTIKVSVNMDDYYQIRDAEEAEKNPS